MTLDSVGLQQALRYTIDLKSGLVRTPMIGQLMKGDKKANRVIVEIRDGSNPVDLSGVTVTGSFIRPPDAAEISLSGTTSGYAAVVTLDDICYAQEGYCEINVKLTVGETSRTILTLTGYVLSKGSGAYVDISAVIPSIDDIIMQYAEMKAVTARTLEAADKANDAASRAPYVGGNGNWYVWNAEAGKYVDSGSKAQGPVGPQGPAGQNGTGSGTVTSVNGVTPDGTGNVQLDAQKVGALPSGGTAADSAKLAGVEASKYAKKTDLEGVGGADPLTIYPVGSIYMSTNNTSPASLFGGTWERMKDRFLLGAGDTYSLNSIGGAATHALKVEEMPSHKHNVFPLSSSGGTISATDASVFKAKTVAATDGQYDTSIMPMQTNYVGSGKGHNNMPPYIAVNMWKRVS